MQCRASWDSPWLYMVGFLMAMSCLVQLILFLLQKLISSVISVDGSGRLIVGVNISLNSIVNTSVQFSRRSFTVNIVKCQSGVTTIYVYMKPSAPRGVLTSKSSENTGPCNSNLLRIQFQSDLSAYSVHCLESFCDGHKRHSRLRCPNVTTVFQCQHCH